MNIVSRLISSSKFAASSLIFLLTTPLSFTVVAASNVATDPAGRNIPVINGQQSAGGNMSNDAGIEGDGLPPAQPIPRGLVPNSVTAAAACTTWWIKGSLSWKWRGVPGVYITNELIAGTNTYYGGTTNPDECGRPPLTVDRILVDAKSKGTILGVRVNKTAYNTSSVRGLEDSFGIADTADTMCGAEGYHEAYKNGVTWSTFTKSGCN